MNKSIYKIRLIEPIILSSKDKTETALNCLDYIPGNIFLGMVAGKLYKTNTVEEKKKTLDLFHNGCVRFGNAYLSIDNKQSFPIPATWYSYKGKRLNEGVNFYQLLTDEDWKRFAKEGIQIKQTRQGYFVNKEGKISIKTPIKGVVLKSAYNRKRRSAKSEQMYLYEYLEAGQEFIFEVQSRKKEYLDEIKDILIGKKHISKSKSAEFGGVLITHINDVVEDFSPIKDDDMYTVYAKSNLAFVNSDGEFTWKPTAKYLGFESGEINYEKSQIWFDYYHLRNGKRQTYDADRLIIKKGSVFVIENGKPLFDKIENGVGVFLSEGFGDVFVTPNFIDGISKEDIEYINDPLNTNTGVNSYLNNLLQERYIKENQIKSTYEAVDLFIKKSFVKKISPSQWGGIRSLIYQARKDKNPNEKLYNLIFDQEEGYIYHGIMKEKWKGKIKNELKIFIGIINEEGEELNFISDENIDKLLLLTIEISKRR